MLDVDWTHGAEHMWEQHGMTVVEADEALADPDLLLLDPDPRSRSGSSARAIGYSRTAQAVLTVILVHREDRPGAFWGANGWRSNSTDWRLYANHA